MGTRKNRQRVASRIVMAAIVGIGAVYGGLTQELSAVDRAKRVVTLLGQEKFEEVAKDLSAQAAAAMPPSQLGLAWSSVTQQAGAFKSVIDDHVATPGPGLTTVTLGCQFERAALNIIVAFDADNRVAGLRVGPRPVTALPPAPPPPSSRFTEEAVTVGTGEWALPGTLSMPAGRVAAAVVLVHGSGPNDRDETLGPNKPFRDLAWGLANRGIAVLRYEKRTLQYGAKMAGNPNLTVREETTDDALRAVALLRKDDRLDPKRVLVLGHSLGGTLAPRIAAEDRTLAGLVIMAGGTRPLLDVAREQFAYLATLNPASPSPDQGVAMLRKSAPEAYWKDLDSYKPVQTAVALSIPMLILQGGRDYQVTLEDLQGWKVALGERRNVTIKSYPALNHLFLPGEGKSTPAEYDRPDHIPDFVLDDIAMWIYRM